jgi:hypothetical protein
MSRVNLSKAAMGEASPLVVAAPRELTTQQRLAEGIESVAKYEAPFGVLDEYPYNHAPMVRGIKDAKELGARLAPLTDRKEAKREIYRWMAETYAPDLGQGISDQAANATSTALLYLRGNEVLSPEVRNITEEMIGHLGSYVFRDRKIANDYSPETVVFLTMRKPGVVGPRKTTRDEFASK